MLINLSNHPSNNWNEKQINAANDLYGCVSDMDFPQIDPDAGLSEIKKLAEDYLKKIKNIFEEHPFENNAVHLMGELTFTFNLLELLKQNDICVVASTTVRDVSINENGSKVTVFNFVKFRKYY